MNVEITKNQVEEIMAVLPQELRIVLTKMLIQQSSVNPLNIIKKWLTEYESDNAIDLLIARVVASVITDVGGGIAEKYENIPDNVDVTGKELMALAVQKIKEIAAQMECHLEHNECSKCCEHTH